MTKHANRGWRNDFAPNFEAVSVGDMSIWLPTRTAREIREEMQRRHEVATADCAVQAHVPEVASDGMAEARLADETAHLHEIRRMCRTQPQRGHYRVLPNLLQLAMELIKSNGVARSADAEVNKRRQGILRKLVDAGPDRLFAMPVNWRKPLDRLEASLPNFSAPVRVIRNALELAEATGTPPRIPPMLLLGPPGLGKTLFSRRVAEVIGTRHSTLRFDQPVAGAGLRGSDKYWSNSEPGLLFNLIALGDVANPVVLLDEMDKASSDGGRQAIDPLAQLHGALEPETAKRLQDISVDIAFDASLTTYIGTANSLNEIGAPLASRMEIFNIEPMSTSEAVNVAQEICMVALRRVGLDEKIVFEQHALYVLAHFSPRKMQRVAKQAIGAAVAAGRSHIGEAELWVELGGAVARALH